MICKALQNLENRGAKEKPLASGWPAAVELTEGKTEAACQCGNGQ